MIDIFEKRANEKDPDARMYGPKTTKKILVLVDSFEAFMKNLRETADDVRERFAPLAEARELQEKRDEERRNAEKEASRLREEALELAEEEDQRRRQAEEEERRRTRDAEEERAAAERARLVSERLRRKREQMLARQARETAALSMTPEDAIVQLRNDTLGQEEKTLETALSCLGLVVDNVMNDPDEVRWRRLRKSNPLLQRDLLRFYGGWCFLITCGFREKILKLSEEERLSREVQWFYELFAPSELPSAGGRADVPALAKAYTSGGRRPTDLWKRLREKYGRTHEDVLREMRKDTSGRFAEEGECYLILEEPPIEAKEAWSSWYDRLKRASAALKNKNSN